MFNSRHNRLAAFALAASILLSGCASQDNLPNSQPGLQTAHTAGQNQGANTVTVPSAPVENGVWKGEGGCYKLADPGIQDNAVDISIYNGKIYTSTWEFLDKESSMNILVDGESYYQASDIRDLFVDDSGIWVIEDVTDYSTGNASRQYELVLTGFDKQEKLRQNITDYIEDSFPYDMACDKEGQILIMLEDKVILFDREGSFTGQVFLARPPIRLVIGGDGKGYAVTGKEPSGTAAATVFSGSSKSNINQIAAVDPSVKESQILAEYENYQICGGNGDYQFLAANNEGLYGISDVSGTPEPIAVWAELGLSFNGHVKARDMGSGAFLVEDDAARRLLTPADPSEVKPKNIITMASIAGAWNTFSTLIADFNLWSDTYSLKLIDYSQNGQLTSEEALNKLNMDILSGKAPDLFDLSQIPDNYYTAKGLTTDLYPFLDEDSDIGREDLMQLEKIETDGKLFWIPQSFYLDSGIGLKSTFGDRFGWSLDEYLDFQSKYNGEIMYNVTKEGFLNNMSYRYAGEAVDWISKTCQFDSEDFIKILNATAGLRENPESANPADIDYTPSGKRLRERTLIVSVWFLSNIQDIAEARAETGEPISFVGWPTPDGSCGTQLTPSNKLAICSKGNQDGAWEFIKYVISGTSEDFHSVFGFSINRGVLAQQIEESIRESKSNEAAPITQEDVDLLYELLDQSIYLSTPSDQIVKIIMEESGPFLHGDKSAEETAKLIQSRVNLFISE